MDKTIITSFQDLSDLFQNLSDKYDYNDDLSDLINILKNNINAVNQELKEKDIKLDNIKYLNDIVDDIIKFSNKNK